MTTAENKSLLQHVFAETAKGDGRPFVAALAEDVSWTIIGSTQWSKTYRGKSAVLKELLGPTRLSSSLHSRPQLFWAVEQNCGARAQGRATLWRAPLQVSLNREIRDHEREYLAG
jgi:ketosteroid isomerase-like protein